MIISLFFFPYFSLLSSYIFSLSLSNYIFLLLTLKLIRTLSWGNVHRDHHMEYDHQELLRIEQHHWWWIQKIYWIWLLHLNLSHLREEEGTCLEGGIPNFRLDPRGLMSYHESFSLLPFAYLTLSIGSLTWEWKMKRIWCKRKTHPLIQHHFSELPLLISSHFFSIFVFLLHSYYLLHHLHSWIQKSTTYNIATTLVYLYATTHAFHHTLTFYIILSTIYLAYHQYMSKKYIYIHTTSTITFVTT